MIKADRSSELKITYATIFVVLVVVGVWAYFSRPPHPTLAERPRTLNLLAVGDINLGRQTGQKILAGDPNYAFEYLDQRISEYDIAFGNLESQLVDLGGETQSPTNEYRFAGPPAGADGLKAAGFDIVSIANNHMWDYGKDALFSTIDNLDRVGLKHAGASKDTSTVYQPAIIEVNQQKVAFLAATNLLNGYERSGATDYVAWADTDKLVSAINQVKSSVDWVVVSLHWGTEYAPQPSQAERDLAHQLIDAGASVIIGHHPHVPQGVEEYNGGVILYSLGNFAFWQPMDYWTQHSFIAEVTLDPTNGIATYNPIAINSGWQPRLATDPDETKILQYIAKLSEAFTKK
jgi:poly-gamma-glutamate capsule biosynthesis protein CapA/YwtB (metallophosphatase superfamily)